tara:strand:- start:331 stop:534 length:204 start_codon:yes stop_codon:yes gene_type:complete
MNAASDVGLTSPVFSNPAPGLGDVVGVDGFAPGGVTIVPLPLLPPPQAASKAQDKIPTPDRNTETVI